jgi:hypothetical protein
MPINNLLVFKVFSLRSNGIIQPFIRNLSYCRLGVYADSKQARTSFARRTCQSLKLKLTCLEILDNPRKIKKIFLTICLIPSQAGLKQRVHMMNGFSHSREL